MTALLQIVFGEDHPAFAGHFPGAPIVPGVLLLAEALEQLGRSGRLPVETACIQSAKFLRAVRPGEIIEVALLQRDAHHSHLQLSSAGMAVAEARLEHRVAYVDTTRHE